MSHAVPPVVRIHSVGDRAILVQLSSLAEALALYALLKDHPEEGQLDVVVAAETVLVSADSTATARRIAARVHTADLTTRIGRDDTLVVIDTCYDGEDLAEVARVMGLGADGVVAFHSGQDWTAACGGFAPGFMYLTGADGGVPIPRRTSPRTVVPAGSVALASLYSAVYPGSSPGGWQLIGRTAARMWEPVREIPSLVSPGNRVRFRPVRELVELIAGTPGAVSAAGSGTPAATGSGGDTSDTDSGPPRGTGVTVRSPGLHTTIQDLGRPGFADIGVTGSGALDRGALRQANRLVGNHTGAAGLETVLGGLELEAVGDQVLAITGACVPLEISATTGLRRRVPTAAPFALLSGECITLGAPTSGFRSYVAIRGGIDVPPVVGARATDVLSGIGPQLAAAATFLPTAAAGSVVGFPEVPAATPEAATVLRFVPGPRADWFTEEATTGFPTQVWTVTPRSNRIGLHLAGPALEHAREDELVSEGTVSGAIQVPPSGLPVLFLADHPVTGGYPVIGVVVSADLDKAAQLAPGARIRFEPIPGAGPVQR